MKNPVPIHEFWSLPGDEEWIDAEEKRLMEILEESKKFYAERDKKRMTNA